MAWQTRTVCQFIAATVRVDKGKQNPLMEAANKIVLDTQESTELEALSSKPQVKENPVGSYERLMSGFNSRG